MVLLCTRLHGDSLTAVRREGTRWMAGRLVPSPGSTTRITVSVLSGCCAGCRDRCASQRLRLRRSADRPGDLRQCQLLHRRSGPVGQRLRWCSQWLGRGGRPDRSDRVDHPAGRRRAPVPARPAGQREDIGSTTAWKRPLMRHSAAKDIQARELRAPNDPSVGRTGHKVWTQRVVPGPKFGTVGPSRAQSSERVAGLVPAGSAVSGNVA